ncbi:DoxX family protein [Frateuria sp. YIM B11624]|uniref:DoxX family protein n=1 Tax=Frateuria sp. YIM B11624 TaxID=3143185 RepID=UPI003C70B594
MTDTGSFFASIAIGALAAFLLLRARDDSSGPRWLSRGFAALCMADALVGLFGVIAVTLHLSPSAAFYRAMIGGTVAVGQVIAGFAVGAAVAPLVGRRPEGARIAASAEPAWVTIGLAWYVALSFAGFEIGKAAHDTQMRQFFLGSGYTVAFMYAVMVLEIIGAAGLLVARLRTAAAVLLGALMLGAIATHARNGDPVTDSLDAVRMLLLVASVALLDRFRRGARPRGGALSNAYVDK